ncbi:hypothetical protein V2G26_009445 [Clonostachys chloroleuca]
MFKFYLILFTAVPAIADIYQVEAPAGFFPGPKSGIGSWYRAAAGQDDTNGQSWCGYKYQNSDPVFAPSLKAMGGGTWSSNPTQWQQSSRKHCGLEAKVTDPSTGRTSLMYIGDAFDDAWVKTPASIDIMIDSFSSLHGNPNGDKNKVINPVNWELTGRVNTKYAAPGATWPSIGTSNPTPGTPSPGTLGTKCDGQTTICSSGLTCLSPNGICSDQPCNWGCTGWTCSSSSPCQKPNQCSKSVCKLA